jgi:phosphatidylserine decarboxylase
MVGISLLCGTATLAAGLAAAAGYVWATPVAGVCVIVWIGGLAFFRDPYRRPPPGADIMVAPADGRVVETTGLDHYDDLGEAVTRIAIFLSIFDVHINRSPCAGTVRAIRYTPGRFLDARDQRSRELNESNAILIEPDDPSIGPVLVRQIAGKVARRIVCSIKVGDHVEAGQRIGLIKFGSRTELILTDRSGYVPVVAVGDRTRGADTILARREATGQPASAADTPELTRAQTPA